MSLQLTSPPTQEPVSLAEAKAWLRVESGTDEDDLITSLIAAARVRCEWHCGRAFAAQGWMLWLDGIGDGCIALPLPPLVSVDAVTLYAAGDTAAVLDASGYQVDAPGGRLIFASPHPGLRAVNACSIAFTAGYGVGADVPAPIKSAILQTIAWLYEHRGGDAAPVPDGALALLAPYRVTRL
ncbi:MAG: hypothetical protein BGN85_10995 [Alphaproteobacteria bacterium 64-11]|nr:phage head-tail connector protein [Alphaproteobacteria bacterium]OJU09908.1 MAG: hypothetical protein BGN85_10995 [Alphaproteobacteria bacterium 64-11]